MMAALLTSVAPAAARADDIRLSAAGAPASVSKGATLLFQLSGIPDGIGGTIKLKLKFHAVNILPAYEKVRIILRHGTTLVLAARDCYSLHAPAELTPKCQFDLPISEAEAGASTTWQLSVTNTSHFDLVGVNIAKESTDLNPLVPSFQTLYSPICPSTKALPGFLPTVTISPRTTVERQIEGIGPSSGDVVMRFKWHGTPFEDSPLSLEIMNRDEVVASSTCFSFHSANTPKCVFTFAFATRPPSGWKVRIRNPHAATASGFDDRKGDDLDPTIPSFVSTYKPKC
jgi:hypothetical protein